MTHLHHVNGSAPLDRTYREQPDNGADERAYLKFMQEEFPLILK